MKNNLSRAGIMGIVLAVLGIILFVALWLLLGGAGLNSLARLLVSLCIPPAVIAGVLGVYMLVARPGDSKE